MSLSRLFLSSLIVATLSLAGCGSRDDRPKSIGYAFVAQPDLKLRAELDAKAPVTATVQNGERVEIVRTFRRFVRVRTKTGAEGWVHERQLMSSREIDKLDRASERLRKLPSQGSATVYATLNVHIEPHRQSPTFYQIREKTHVTVLGHQLVPRGPYKPEPLLPPPKPKAVKKPSRPSESPPIITPDPPGPPEDWLEISKSPSSPEPEPEPEQTSVSGEDWSLVLVPDGRVGWVLSRMLAMAIPNEVAQYAEGARITSYFSLGKVLDGNVEKHNWLWTTIRARNVSYEYDSFRIFIWSLRRHRYETAYIERNLEGYFPTRVQTVKVTEGGRTVDVPGFTVITRDKDGQVYERKFAFQGYLVRELERTPSQIPIPPWEDVPEPQAAAPAVSGTSQPASWFSRTKHWLGK